MDEPQFDGDTHVEFDLEGSFIVTRAVAVVEVVDGNMDKTLKIASIGRPHSWDKLGMLEAGSEVERARIRGGASG